MSTIPAAFIGHGNPMNALETNQWTTAWNEFGASLDEATAILAISAHWYIGITAVTAMEHPRTIHDFSGFPDELFAVEYPAPGDPQLARSVMATLDPIDVGLDTDSWGLDHGTWSILAHVRPQADLPVVQLSIHSGLPLDEHLAIGRALAPLRDQGVAIICSGNVVHNLGRVEWGRPGQGSDWAEDFDHAASELLRTRPAEIAELLDHPAFSLAVPTAEHFLPLVYLAGLADAAETTASTLIEGCDLGSLSMTSYRIDD